MLEQHVVNVRTHIHAMTEDPSNKERLYVTNEDIVKLASIGRDTVFAVTAPQGTSLIVPDPDKTAPGQPPQYRCVLTLASGRFVNPVVPRAFVLPRSGNHLCSTHSGIVAGTLFLDM